MADRASGSYVWTTDGRKHLDMACGIGALLLPAWPPPPLLSLQQGGLAKISTIHAVRAYTTPNTPCKACFATRQPHRRPCPLPPLLAALQGC